MEGVRSYPSDSKLEAAAIESLAHALLQNFEKRRLNKKNKFQQVFICEPGEACHALLKAQQAVREAIGH
jgi:hypothetical protein